MSRQHRATSDSIQPRGSLGLLVDPVFGPYFAGVLFATTGVWVHNIVGAILVYRLTESALLVGLVSVAQFTPQLMFAPLSGARADRGDRRRQVVLGQAFVVLGSGGLACTLFMVDVDELHNAAPVVAAALILGIGFVIAQPAMLALLPSLVPPNELASAIALSQFPFTVARAAGPALGVLIAVKLGPAPAFAIAALCNLVFVLVMARLPIVTRSRRPKAYDGSVRAALRYVRTDSTLKRLLLGVAAIGIAVDPAVTLTPPLSRAFGRGSELVGAFASAFGVGAAASFLLLGFARRRLGLPRLCAAGFSLLAFSMLGTAASITPTLAVTAFALAGVGWIVTLTSLSTQIQARLPDDLHGRVMALWAVAFVGSRPLAAAFNGAIADTISVQVAFVVVAVIVIGAGWLCRPGKFPA